MTLTDIIDETRYSYDHFHSNNDVECVYGIVIIKVTVPPNTQVVQQWDVEQHGCIGWGRGYT